MALRLLQKCKNHQKKKENGPTGYGSQKVKLTKNKIRHHFDAISYWDSWPHWASYNSRVAEDYIE